MKRNIILILLLIFCVFSCGKKSNLEYPGKQKRPKFDNVIERNDF